MFFKIYSKMNSRTNEGCFRTEIGNSKFNSQAKFDQVIRNTQFQNIKNDIINKDNDRNGRIIQIGKSKRKRFEYHAKLNNSSNPPEYSQDFQTRNNSSATDNIYEMSKENSYLIRNKFSKFGSKCLMLKKITNYKANFDIQESKILGFPEKLDHKVIHHVHKNNIKKEKILKYKEKMNSLQNSFTILHMGSKKLNNTYNDLLPLRKKFNFQNEQIISAMKKAPKIINILLTERLSPKLRKIDHFPKVIKRINLENNQFLSQIIQRRYNYLNSDFINRLNENKKMFIKSKCPFENSHKIKLFEQKLWKLENNR